MVASNQSNQVANLSDSLFLWIYLQKNRGAFLEQKWTVHLSHTHTHSPALKMRSNKMENTLPHWLGNLSYQQTWQHELNAAKPAIMCDLFHGVIHSIYLQKKTGMGRPSHPRSSALKIRSNNMETVCFAAKRATCLTTSVWKLSPGKIQ